MMFSNSQQGQYDSILASPEHFGVKMKSVTFSVWGSIYVVLMKNIKELTYPEAVHTTNWKSICFGWLEDATRVVFAPVSDKVKIGNINMHTLPCKDLTGGK